MSGIPRSNKFWEQIKSIIGNFHILLSLLRDLNVALFKFYPIHWCFSTVWIFKGYRSQVITTPLEMETFNIRQQYMLSICILSKPFFASRYPPVQLTLSHQAQGAQLNIPSLFPIAHVCLFFIYSMLSFPYALPSRNTPYVFRPLFLRPGMLLHPLSGPGFTFSHPELLEVFLCCPVS